MAGHYLCFSIVLLRQGQKEVALVMSAGAGPGTAHPYVVHTAQVNLSVNPFISQLRWP